MVRLQEVLAMAGVATASQARAAVNAGVRTELVGRSLLTAPTRTYAVTTNPFAIPVVLPALVLCFIGAEIALLAGANANVLAGTFLFATAGILLIPAVILRGTLTVTDTGITFERGKDTMSAAWRDVTSLTWRQDCGLCMSVAGQKQTKQDWKLPGGFRAIDGDYARIPMRMFGDRQYAMLYDIRDHLPETATMPALEKASSRGGLKLYLYGAVVVIDVVALAVVAWVYHP